MIEENKTGLLAREEGDQKYKSGKDNLNQNSNHSDEECLAAAARKAGAKPDAVPASDDSKYPKGIVDVKCLRIRKDHTTESLMVGGLIFGDVVTIFEKWTDGKEIWARIGENQWAAMFLNNDTYIKEQK